MRDSGVGIGAALPAALAILLAAVPALAQSGDRPGFARAAALFARLPTLDRNEASLELMATGDFNGMASLQFGPRLYDAVAGFQARQGLAADGALTRETRAALGDEGARIFNSWGFAFLDHPTAEASLAVPFGFGLAQSRTPHGYALEDRRRTMSVDFAFFPDGEMGLDQVFANLTRTGPGRQLDLQVLRPTFLAVSGTSGGKSFYARYIVVPDGIAGFTLSWSRDAYPNAGRIATVMANEIYPRRTQDGGGKGPGLAEAMPGDRDGEDIARADAGTGRTPLNAGSDADSEAALRRMEQDRAERVRLAAEAEQQRQRMAEARAAEAAAAEATRQAALDRLAAERLGRLKKAAEARLADAARFVRDNRDDPRVEPILGDIAALQGVASGRDARAIESRTATLAAALDADPVYAADAARRAEAEKRERACTLAEARRLIGIQRAVLIEASRRDPRGQDTVGFMALVEQSRAPGVGADLDRAQAVVGRMGEAIDRAGLQASLAVARADADRAAPADADPSCPR